MLQSIEVQNYALIENLKIDFFPGFSIITGETGAGKSILLGALALITGERADTAMLNNKARKCIVEATFEISAYRMDSIFEKHDLDNENPLIIRREIRENGKSRAFINDSPVNLTILKDFGSRLIDIHSQHQNLNLSDHEFQLTVLDNFGQITNVLHEYCERYQEYMTLHKDFHALQEKNNHEKADYDYYQFQFNQLEDAGLREGEQEELEEELEKQTHAEEIKQNLSYSVNLLSATETSVIQHLYNIKNALQKLLAYFPKMKEFHDRLDSAYIDLKDLSGEMELMAEDVIYDPQKIEQINSRINLIYDLQQKHRVSSVHELIAIKNQFENKIQTIESYDQELTFMSKQLQEKEKEVLTLAQKLSKKRKNSHAMLEQKVLTFLTQLGMPNARFKVLIEAKEKFDANGMDKVSFLFTANKHGELMELSKVASGGEISRLMLSLKSILSENESMPTIIFDEIDAGVSGEIANKMGNIIKELASRMQVVNITHLPQIASKGNYHYKVYKTENHQATITEIKQLNDDERIQEIAKMLSGEALTESAISNARELLSLK